MGWLGAAGSILLIGALYWAFVRTDSEPAPEEPAAVPVQEPAAEPEPAAKPEAPAKPEAAAPESEPEAGSEVALDGEALFKLTCPACHGQDAKGMPGLGKDMTNSKFINDMSDEELAEFIVQGRTADDPANTTGVAMPPKGLNPALGDAEIMAIVRYMRSLSE